MHNIDIWVKWAHFVSYKGLMALIFVLLWQNALIAYLFAIMWHTTEWHCKICNASITTHRQGLIFIWFEWSTSIDTLYLWAFWLLHCHVDFCYSKLLFPSNTDCYSPSTLVCSLCFCIDNNFCAWLYFFVYGHDKYNKSKCIIYVDWPFIPPLCYPHVF